MMEIDLPLPPKALGLHRPALCTHGPTGCPFGFEWTQCHMLGCGKDIHDPEVHVIPKSGGWEGCCGRCDAARKEVLPR